MSARPGPGLSARHHGDSVISDDGRGRLLRRARRTRRPRCLRLLGWLRGRRPAGRRRRRGRAGQDHGADVRRRAPARATGDVPRRGRGDGHADPPRRPGRDGDRQVARLPRPGRAQRQEGRRGHRDQGAAGPAGREGPAAGRGGSRPPGAAGLRRAQGTQQLRLPPAGGRGGLGWDPGRARRPGGGRADEPAPDRGDRARERATRRATRGHRRGSAPAGGLVAEVAERRPGRPELRALRPGLEHGQRRPTGVPGRLQLPVGRALLRRGRPRTGVGWPTSSWSTPTSTGRTWPAAVSCCPSTTWSSSTRRTSSKRS